jgi:hypothetical protein
VAARASRVIQKVSVQLAGPSTSTRPGSSGSTAYFERLYQAFLLAEQSGQGPIDRFYRMAGFVVRLRLANPILASKITPALEHVALDAIHPDPDLTVCLWDQASMSMEMPAPAWSWDDIIARGDIRGFSDDRIFAAFHLGSNALSMLDSARDLALYWTREASELPYYETGAPLVAILSRWLCRQGLQLTHAAAVGTARGGVLLVGRGGSGKSTAAMASIHSNLFYLSDDYCAITTRPTPTAYSLYNTCKLDAGSLERFPELEPAIEHEARISPPKSLIFVHELYPDKILTSFPVRAILVLRLTGLTETELIPSTPSTALKALAPSTIFQLSGAGQPSFHLIGEFVRRVPCYILDLGTDLSGIPDIIMGVIGDRA